VRLKVTLEAPGPFLLPWHYPELLRGAVYTALRRWDPELAKAMHGEGLVVAGRRYKPFTYSWLHPKAVHRRPEGLFMEPPVWWWISSPLSQVLEAIAGPFLTLGAVNLGGVVLAVSLVEVEGIPEMEPPVVLETLAPIVASTAEERDGRLCKVFLSPWQEDFHRVLTQNLINKGRALGYAVTEEMAVRLEPLGGVRSRLVKVSGLAVRGFEGRFRALGHPLLLRIAYDWGFGERNAQGFGMIRLVGR